MSQAENQMTDDEIHAALLRYNPDYKKSAKLSENDRLIKIKQLHHFQARERKELEVKEKEAKLKEKEEFHKEKEAQRKQKEDQKSKDQKRGRESLNFSYISEVPVGESQVNTNGANSIHEESELPKLTQAKKRGRKTLNTSEVSSQSSFADSTNSQNDLLKKEEQQEVKGPRRGRKSVNPPAAIVTPIVSAAPSPMMMSTTKVVPATRVTQAAKISLAARVTPGLSAEQAAVTAAPVGQPNMAPAVIEPVEPPTKKGRATGRKSTLSVLDMTTQLSPIKELEQEVSSTVVSGKLSSASNGAKSDTSSVNQAGIEVSIVNVTLGRPASDLNMSLCMLDSKKNWKALAQGHTQPRGICTDLLSGAQFRTGLYKLQLDTRSYFKSMSITPVFPSVEIVFEITDTTQMHRISVDIGPYHYTASVTSV